MSVLNLLPVAPPTAAPSSRDPALSPMNPGRGEGKTFELPAAVTAESDAGSALTGATEVEASSLASGEGNAESSASPQTGPSDLTIPAAALADALPLAGEAPVIQDSRLNPLRAGDKQPAPASLGLAALLPFGGTAVVAAEHVLQEASAESAPQPGLPAADAEFSEHRGQRSEDAEEQADDEEAPTAAMPALAVQTVAPAPPAELAMSPLPIVPATPISNAVTPDEVPASAVESRPPTTGEERADPARPTAEWVPARVPSPDAAPAGRPVTALKSPAVNDLKHAPVVVPTPVAAATAALPTPSSPLPLAIAATGDRPTQPGVDESAPDSDERSSEGEEGLTAATNAPTPEGRFAASAANPAALSKTAASRKSSGPVADFNLKDARNGVARADKASSRSANPSSPQGDAPAFVLPGLAMEARAVPAVPPPPSLQATPPPTESSGSAPVAPGGESSPSSAREAENMSPTTPRALDIRSQAWRENLRDTARLRMPGLGAAGTLQTITLQLQPRLMGAVTMTLALTASGGVQLRLGAANERTRRFFSAEAPAIAASFARGGLNVSRIEILETQTDPAVA